MRVSMFCMEVAALIAIGGLFLVGLGCFLGPSLLAPAGLRGIVLLMVDVGAVGFIALAFVSHARSPSAHSEERRKQEAAHRLALVGLAIVILVLLLAPLLFISCALA